MSRRFALSLFAVFLVLLTISCSSTKGAVEVVKEEDAVEQVLPVSITEDGRIILFVCVGRIKASKGASIVEAAQIMKGLGCVGAVNFDGGGSTAMLVQGNRVNSYESNTSGATEDRAVGSVMGFFLKK